MPRSTRSNKETHLLFSPDPARLERSIRKEARNSSIDNNACSSLDSRQPPSTQALVPSTDTRSPPSTEDTHLPLTDIFHPTSIDTYVRTSIDTEPRDMVATLILVREERGGPYDQEGHLRNATGQRIDAQGAAVPEDRSTTPTESTAFCNAVRIMTHEDLAAKHPHLPSPVYVKIDRHSDPSSTDIRSPSLIDIRRP
ncbi:hypothetical protein F2Q69_00053480 [Brassica cretica]|uniref:Uncharacterized protein n=1 Tax=Brassica cretica TaxID=69181 RepID=A0A8S9MQ01_BRACR|nr:hypothetical protein F2Q69_00053480 [Brassica cretica]